ncbi:MAG: penicillin-binding protein 2 [Candidatus Uhrbacteria bacterium]|nr:penicillin-binding protein 2 [Candidatus Uhrbacteria bacterium]
MFTPWKQKPASHIFVVQHHDGFGLKRNKSSDAFDATDSYVSDDLHSHERSIKSTLSHKRLVIGFGIFFFVFFCFFSRAAYLQVFQGTHFHALADANRYRITRVVSPRGKILDRNGVVLATNVPSFLLTMTIADLPKNQDERNKVIQGVCDHVGVQHADIDLLLTQYAKQPQEHIPVLRNIPYESAMRLTIEIAQYPGFNLIATVQRSYPSTAVSLSHVLGYMGKITPDESIQLASTGYRPIDQIGKTGIERTAETQLRGIPGKLVTEVDASGHELSVISKTDPIPGTDVHLGIDLELQKYIEIQLQTILQNVHATRASVIAIDPNTGTVRALVSLPAFDNNIFSNQISQETYQQLSQDPDQPLFFRAISGNFPSGSVFKPVIAYAALTEHVVSEHTSFLSTGGLHVGDWFFPDWKAGGHGVTDVRKAIAESVNTFFYIVGGGFQDTIGLGVDRIGQYAQMFGFGSPTGIDLPNESSGFIPTKDWKQKTKGERWYVGDTYHLAIGQGDFLTTPIQMAVATATIANNGYAIRPHVIDSGTTPEKVQIKNLDADALRIVQEGMRQSVTNGSDRRLQNLVLPVAGKTGTAQSGIGKPTHSWFTGYGPYDKPTLELTVLVEEGGESTSAAVPLADEIFAWWFAHGNK